MSNTHSAVHEQGAQQRNRSNFLIYALCFVVFLAIALTGQLLGFDWRAWLPGAEGAKSLFGGVKAAVYTSMSHLL